MHKILLACYLNRQLKLNGCKFLFRPASVFRQTPGVGREPDLTENCLTLCEEEPSTRLKNWIRNDWISHEGGISHEVLFLWMPSRDQADLICKEHCWLRLLREGVEGQPRKSLTFSLPLTVTWVFLPGREVVAWGSWGGNRDQNHWPQSKHNTEKDNEL